MIEAVDEGEELPYSKPQFPALTPRPGASKACHLSRGSSKASRNKCVGYQFLHTGRVLKLGMWH